MTIEATYAPDIPYQINKLQEEKAAVEEALEIEREEISKFQEKSEE